MRLHLEEELLTSQQQTRVTEAQKDEDRSRILAKLIEKGVQRGTVRAIRDELGLTDISMRRFRSACWCLYFGDEKLGVSQMIVFRHATEDGDGMRSQGPNEFVIRPLSHPRL